MKNEKISIVIPVKIIGEYSIKESLPSFLNQTYQNFEVILLPNQKSSIDRDLGKKYSWLRIIPTGHVTRPAQKRNIGAKYAKGTIIAFIDDDAYPSSKWLEKAVYYFDKKQVAAVCGPGILPKEGNIWEQVFDLVLCSPIGSGGNTYRFTPEKPRLVDDYPSMNFLIKKTVFEELGGFDNDYWPGEDSKICEDLVYGKKLKIYYHPDVLIYHHRRDNIFGFLKQHSQYGFHRGAFFAHGDQNSKKFSYLIPTLFVLYLLCLLVLKLTPVFFSAPLIASIVFLPLIVYISLTVMQLIANIVQIKKIPISLLAVGTMVLTHIVYGIFFIKGFWIGLLKHDRLYS